VFYIMKITFYIGLRCYPNETTTVMNCDADVMNVPTMPHAILYTDGYINIGLGTNFSTSQLSIV